MRPGLASPKETTGNSLWGRNFGLDVETQCRGSAGEPCQTSVGEIKEASLKCESASVLFEINSGTRPDIRERLAASSHVREAIAAEFDAGAT